MKIIQALLVALDAMKNDFHTTGKCDLTLARQMEPGTPGTWVLTKNSPYTEYISRGLLLKYFYFYLKKTTTEISVLFYVYVKFMNIIENFSRRILEMFANGLLDIWTRWYQPDVRQCLDKANKIMQLKPSKNNPPQLSLTNLTGAFVVLLVGYLVTFAAFISEHLFWHAKLF